MAPPPPNSPIFGRNEAAVTVRPDFWHDPNVGAVGALVAFIVIVVVGALFVGIFH